MCIASYFYFFLIFLFTTSLKHLGILLTCIIFTNSEYVKPLMLGFGLWHNFEKFSLLFITAFVALINLTMQAFSFNPRGSITFSQCGHWGVNQDKWY